MQINWRTESAIENSLVRAGCPPPEGLVKLKPKVCTQVYHGKFKVVSACVINMSHGSSMGKCK